MLRLFATIIFALTTLTARAQQILGGNNLLGAPPAQSIGKEANWYIDFITGNVWGPKTSGQWPFNSNLATLTIGTLAVGHGGTGANNPTQAQLNLGVVPQSTLRGNAGSFNTITIIGNNAGPGLSNTSVASTYIGEGSGGGAENLIGCTPSGTTGVTGAENTGVGWGTLGMATTAAFDTALGTAALPCISTGTNDVAVGTDAMRNVIDGSFDTVVGFAAMRNPTNGVTQSVAIGAYALEGIATSTGVGNTAVGFGVMTLWTTGFADTAVGNFAGGAITTGDHNVLIGSYSGTALTTGQFDTCLGGLSCAAETTGIANTVVGYEALFNANGSSRNAGLGNFALLQCTTCSSNVALGWSAGIAITTGTNNVIIGENVDPVLTTGTGNVVIGTGPSCAAPTSGATGTLQICAGGSPLLLGTNGTTPTLGAIRAAGVIGMNGYTVANLLAFPNPKAGDISYVTDATTCTRGSALTGGGSTFCEVVYTGTGWQGL